MRHFIPQFEDKDCGLACLRMLLAHYSRSKAYESYCLPGEPPYSYQAIADGAKEEGLDLQFFDAVSVKEIEKNAEWPLLVTLSDGESSHIVLLEGRSKKKLKVVDPAKGRYTMSFPEFEKKWNKIHGVVKGYRKQERSIEKNRPLIPVWKTVLLSSLNALEMASLLVAFEFFSEKGNYLIPIICFAACALLMILQRVLLKRFQKQFDGLYLFGIPDKDPKRTTRNFRSFFAVKRNLFLGPIRVILLSLLALVILFLVGWNEPVFFIPVAGMATFLLSREFFLRRKLKQEEKDLEKMEGDLPNLKDRNASYRLLEKIAEQSYRLADREESLQILYRLAILILAIIPQFFVETVSLNHYLFHVFALFGIGESFEAVIAFFESGMERKREELYFRFRIGRKARKP